MTDPLQLIAGGLATVPTNDLFAFLTDYFGKEKVERVVVGEPRQNDGSPSENYARVKQFAASFKKRFPHIPIDFYDERFTSVLAHHAIIEGGLKKKTRQDKALVDEVSAIIILQDYMSAQKFQLRKNT